MKFTKEEAIQTCERILHDTHYNLLYGCYACYHFDGRCELGNKPNPRCPQYKNDTITTNQVRNDILYNPENIKRSWKYICQVDRELFIAIYGENLNDLGVELEK